MQTAVVAIVDHIPTDCEIGPRDAEWAQTNTGNSKKMKPTATEMNVEDSKTIDQDRALTSIFEERAENLNQNELRKWSAETERDRALLVKLKRVRREVAKWPARFGQVNTSQDGLFCFTCRRPRTSRACEVLPYRCV